MVMEVLSPSTHDFDTIVKLDEYKTIESMDHILLVEPNAPEAILWSRGPEQEWGQRRISGIESTIEIRSLGIAVRLENIYAGLTFRRTPTMIDLPES
jgi:Uma2 family endonuclease